MNPIVTVNVTETVAPTPNTLQKRGAVLSQGGTTLASGAFEFLSAESDLTPLLPAAVAITSMSYASGEVTVVVAAHGMTTGDVFVTTVVGAIPTAYNGTYQASVTDGTHFKFNISSDPGANTTPGTYTRRNVAELQSMVSTFFAQGVNQGVYVLELGAGEVSDGVTALDTFIDGQPSQFYSYLVPRSWDSVSAFLTFLADFESLTAKTYFWVTTTVPNYTNYTDQMKDVFALIEAPNYSPWSANVFTAASWSGGIVTATTTSAHGVKVGQQFRVTGNTPSGYNGYTIALEGTTGSTLKYARATNPGVNTVLGTLVANTYTSAGTPLTEFSLAAAFRNALNYDPSPANRVAPFCFSYLFGVTQFPLPGNGSLLTTLEAAEINIVGTGAEGGISNDVLFWGTTADGNDFTFWYSVDWVQLNLDLDVANAVINGSNNPQNPLYYNQDGINRLQAVAVRTMASGISNGLVLGNITQTQLDQQTFVNNVNAGKYAGQTVVNAVPFITYSEANPSDFAIGKYAGLSVAYVPNRGFKHIFINVNVSQFVAP
jgi:hypothetical protein